MVYDAALKSGWVYYAVALLGSFFTAASFLKLGHAAFFGKRSDENRLVKEAPVPMLIPMIVLAALCILFGLGNGLPLAGLIQPAVGDAVTHGESFAGFPASTLLVALTAGVLLLALIHHAPLLSPVYTVAEAGIIDPYAIGRWVMKGVAAALYGIDRAFDWIYDTAAVKAAHGVSWITRRLHNGSVNRYIVWSIAGAAAVVLATLAVLGGGR